ncbi:MAG: hypothetical protein EOP39_19030 [Rubrivivax sp.]|nr:MAG: hypothetical protein EOP39_19030 [Rubrivivax sp.]
MRLRSRPAWLERACVAILIAGLALLGWQWLRPKAVKGGSEASAPAPQGVASAAMGVRLSSADELLGEVDRQDWLVRRWREQPEVLVIQFPGLLAQGQALNRAAALLEKGRGGRERVLHDEELHALVTSSGDNMATFFLGHDYRADDLARFFNLAQAQGVSLNGGEQRLLDLLLQVGLISRQPSGATAAYAGSGVGALISFSGPQDDDPYTQPDERLDGVRRASVLQHELSHGRFFVDTAYREHCWRFWRERLTDAERETWRRYLDALDYDRGNEELMVNETQALLMHTPDSRDFSAASLGGDARALAAQVQRFREGR